MYSSWSDSLQLRQCWLHLRLMRSRKGVDPLSFCLAYPTPVSVYCHPILIPSVSHAVCKMLCVQRWIKVSAMNRQLQISKIKEKKSNLHPRRKGYLWKTRKKFDPHRMFFPDSKHSRQWGWSQRAEGLWLDHALCGVLENTHSWVLSAEHAWAHIT